MEVEALLDKQVRVIACGAEHMACTVVHGWVPDEEAKSCMACRKTFTVITRRVSFNWNAVDPHYDPNPNSHSVHCSGYQTTTHLFPTCEGLLIGAW